MQNNLSFSLRPVMRLPILALVSLLASLALADVKFTTPAAGASIPGGGKISIAWTESGDSPSISTFSSYTLFLMAGGNDDNNMQQLAAIVTTATSFSSGYTASGTIDAGVGGSTKNAYFLKMIAVSKEGGQVINYSDRFSLTGMTGTFSPTVQQGIAAAGGSTNGPATENQVNTNANAAAGEGGAFTVAYNLQTGLTKFAPMQPIPPTKITAKSATPPNPTSAFTVATTFLALPSILTTITDSQTFSVSSIENTMAAASQPTGDMAKFLKRWQD